MSPLSVLLTLAAYFVILFTVSYLAGRKADNAGFFTGNRRSSWPVVAFAMIGASISGVTYVSVPGMVKDSGFGYLQMVQGFIAGQFIIAFVLTPLFYRLNLVSVYEYLESRFGRASYRTGAWFFFLSKMLGAAVRLMLVCITLQLLVFGPCGLPFVLNAALTVALVWLYTWRGGVKSLIWTDSLKTLCLIVSVVLCIGYMASGLGLTLDGAAEAVMSSELSRIFFFDDPNNRQYFFKQFLAGVFTTIAMNGLDQDMMQRNLSCRNSRESQKNLLTSALLQFFVILLFLMLGVLLYLFAENRGIRVEKSDELFPLIATGGYLPVVVGILTTSFTVDILGIKGKTEAEVARLRRRVHAGMAVLMGIVIVAINLLNNTSVINAVYTLASYTYGPILGLFAFGIFCRRRVRDRYIPLVALASPALCYVLQRNSEAWFGGYQFSYELLIFNALFTCLGLWMVSLPRKNV